MRYCTPLKDFSGDVRTNVFVSKLVSKAHTLRLVLDRFAVNDGVLKVLHDRLMDRITLSPR
jgi:hypothetical protein